MASATASTLLANLAHDLATATARVSELQFHPIAQDARKQEEIDDLKKRVGDLDEQMKVFRERVMQTEAELDVLKASQVELQAARYNDVRKAWNKTIGIYGNIHALHHYKTNEPISEFPRCVSSDINRMNVPEMNRILECLGLSAVPDFHTGYIRLAAAVGC